MQTITVQQVREGSHLDKTSWVAGKQVILLHNNAYSHTTSVTTQILGVFCLECLVYPLIHYTQPRICVWQLPSHWTTEEAL
jgi:hypothetical protein